MKIFGRFLEKLYCAIPNNLAYNDSLTLCYNRTFYETKVIDKYENRDCEIILIALNGLQQTKEKYGDIYTKKKIIQTALFLKRLYKADHGTVCRTGNDEFIIVSKNAHLDVLKENENLFFYGHTTKISNEIFEFAFKRCEAALSKSKRLYFLDHDRRKTNLSKIIGVINN